MSYTYAARQLTKWPPADAAATLWLDLQNERRNNEILRGQVQLWRARHADALALTQEANE